jgi:glycosyltransferase involved in cell wall biosynthesis
MRIRELAADADLRARLVEAGRARVASKFRWHGHVERLIAIFEAAIADGARS